MIREKAKSFHDNLQQKESEGPKAGEVQGSKWQFGNFRKRLGFKNVQVTAEAASAHWEAAERFSGATEKGELPEQVFKSRRECPILETNITEDIT